jgi:hypothetical protein
MPAAWAAVVRPAGVAAEPAVAPLPRRAAARDAVVQRPAALAVAVPRRAVLGARPQPGPEVAPGSLVEAVVAAG